MKKMRAKYKEKIKRCLKEQDLTITMWKSAG
jgi:hypothetical protein